MKGRDTNQGRDSADVASLVQTALAQNSLSGLSEMLKNLAQSVDAYGCILWQVEPGSGVRIDSASGYLVVLAQWFEDGAGSNLHDIPLQSSATGAAVMSQRTVRIHDVGTDERVYRNDPFLREATIKTMCSIPIQFPDTSRGAVNLYRKTPDSFDEDDLFKAEQLAFLVPRLYQAIRDKVSLSVIQKVDSVLHAAEIESRNEPLPTQAARAVLAAICRLVSQAFSSVETTIFLEDRLKAAGIFDLVATTWQPGTGHRIFDQVADGGITGWVISNAKPVTVFDLSSFGRDRELIHREYPGLRWEDSIRLGTSARSSFSADTRQKSRPLSFMAAPIMMGDRVLGVIRCAVAQKEPRYFANRELSLLMLVAARVGQYWHTWLGRRESLAENRSWRALIESIGKLNSFVHSELIKPQPDEHRIFAEALRITSTVINGAEIADIRMLDPRTQELYYAETHGRLWTKGKEEEVIERKSKRFTVDGTPQSVGAVVFKTGMPYLIPDTSKDNYYSELFPGVGGMIVAPIKVKDEIFGVLDITKTGKSDFPKNAVDVAEVLGQQLGLYHYLATIIRNLRKAQTDLGMNIKTLHQLRTAQAQTFEDLKHQLYGPISRAHWRIQDLLRFEALKSQSRLTDDTAAEVLEMSLLAIRGLCAKAMRVATSTGLFAELALGRKLVIHAKPLQADAVVKMMIESAADNQVMIDPDRHITFHVDTGSLEVLRAHKVEADHELLGQAMMNLLDNAAKYSFSHTTVQIYAGMTHRTGRFRITISNTGLPIYPSEMGRCVERGWRSEKASMVTGEGSGIGLWIVDNIMKAHAGDLVITHNRANRLTEISLVFPGAKEVGVV